MRPARFKSAAVFSVLAFILSTAIGPSAASAGDLGLEASPSARPGITMGKPAAPYSKSATVPSGSKTTDALLTTERGKKKAEGHPEKKDRETPEKPEAD